MVREGQHVAITGAIRDTMKTFYTSNYEKNGTNPLAVAISEPSYVPANYSGVTEPNLSPNKELLEEYHDGKVNHDTYVIHFLALLGSRGITPESVVKQFEDGTVFLCFDYEDGDESVCHRFILSDWLNASGLAEVSEI